MNFRLVFIFLVIFSGFMAVTAKLFVVQVIDHEYYSAKRLKNVENRFELAAQRGTIFDRKGRILARDILQYSVAIFKNQALL